MKTISTIIIPLDLSPISQIGFESACRIAELFGARRLHLVHVVRYSQFAFDVPAYSGALVQETIDALRTAAKDRLAELSCPIPEVEIAREIRVGAPAREIVAASEECGAELVVVATANRGRLGHLLLGSVAHTLIRASHCPVLIVAEDRPWKTPHRIVAGIDLSQVSESVLAHALGFARAAAGSIEVCSTCDLLWIDQKERAAFAGKHRAAVGSLIEQLRDPAVAMSSNVSATYPPAKLIVEHAREISADLIVIGASGHNAWQRLFLGSTATRVLSRAHCPVLVVPPASSIGDE